MISSLRTSLRRLKFSSRRDPDAFLKQAKGVIHVGANSGQERDLYDRHGLQVIWVEPIPEIFSTLAKNVAPFPKQRAIRALITDKQDVEYPFNVASNEGASSSILDLKMHKDVWPGVVYERQILLKSNTLPAMIQAEGINLANYDALVMDTQGSELMVLQGAISILHQFRYVKSEVPDFESYAGCCQLSELAAFMDSRDYKQISRHKIAKRPKGGKYYDVVYERGR